MADVPPRPPDEGPDPPGDGPPDGAEADGAAAGDAAADGAAADGAAADGAGADEPPSGDDQTTEVGPDESLAGLSQAPAKDSSDDPIGSDSDRDTASITQQIHRKRVSRRRYWMRRATVLAALLLIIGGGTVGIVALTGGDDDATSPSETVPDTEAPPATTEPAATEAPATTVPDTEPAADTQPAADTEPTDATETTETEPVATEPHETEPDDTEPTDETEPNDTEPTDETEPDDTEPGDTVVDPSEPIGPPEEYDLDVEPSCEISGFAGVGQAGDDVVCIKERLEEITIGPVNFEIDNRFDEELEQAIIWFQEAHDLVPDGVVGPETARALRLWGV